MPPASGDDPYITWPPHLIWRHEGIYTLVSPDGTEDYQFLGRVVASSGIWRLMVNDLQGWLARTAKDEAEGQG
jgi:hypothetical protein